MHVSLTKHGTIIIGIEGVVITPSFFYSCFQFYTKNFIILYTVIKLTREEFELTESASNKLNH